MAVVTPSMFAIPPFTTRMTLMATFSSIRGSPFSAVSLELFWSVSSC